MNGYRQSSDIGGPMDLHEEYRWNVPILTYGFDQNFLDYFGTNGIAAVEAAFRILNQLPRGSDVVLTNFPTQVCNDNSLAAQRGIFDLKSATLSALLEQMGLAEPTRNVFTFRTAETWFFNYVWENQLDRLPWWEWRDWFIPTHIAGRNFDPMGCVPTNVVNDNICGGYIRILSLDPLFARIGVYSIDPLAQQYSAVADWRMSDLWPKPVYPGGYFNGLSRDDVGGLKYLLERENVNYETPIHGVSRPGIGGQHEAAAWRPGVEKIVFIRHPRSARANRFLPFHYRFVETTVVNGLLVRRPAERIVSRPDFLFSASETGETNFPTPMYLRTGTGRWKNHAKWNGSPTNAGPGVIQPPVVITFNKLGSIVATADSYPQDSPGPWVRESRWGSFGSSAETPIAYPAEDARHLEKLSIRLRLWVDLVRQAETPTWQVNVGKGRSVFLQNSSDQARWTTLATVTNVGTAIEWQHFAGSTSQEYFRVVRE